ncbi:MAG TPA: hypothetical protein VGQ41_09000 [Pyrinomonadaceae bacterium]|jgi:hypothetical protein|nr:hypothetical protein [Pyrinomonadaceae bacterium]
MRNPFSHFVNRLHDARVSLDPYPHFCLDNIFPLDYYQALLKNLPASTSYENLYEVTTLKLDHFRHRDQRDMNAGWTNDLSLEQKAFWDDFDTWFLGNDLAQAVLQTFPDQMNARFGAQNHWPAVSVESQLIRHRPGYFLGPHSDLHTKFVVLLIYLAPNENMSHLGTSLYRPRDAGFACPNSTHYQFEDFIKVKTAPYKPNSLLAFFRSDVSFHGLEPLSEHDVQNSGRDLIQYVLYDKAAREQQLHERRLATARRGAP